MSRYRMLRSIHRRSLTSLFRRLLRRVTCQTYQVLVCLEHQLLLQRRAVQPSVVTLLLRKPEVAATWDMARRPTPIQMLLLPHQVPMGPVFLLLELQQGRQRAPQANSLVTVTCRLLMVENSTQPTRTFRVELQESHSLTGPQLQALQNQTQGLSHMEVLHQHQRQVQTRI